MSSRPSSRSGNTAPVPQGPNRLTRLLIASAVAYLVMNLLHLIARTTEAYQSNIQSAVNQVWGDGTTAQVETGPVFSLWNLLTWLVVLAIYAVVHVYLSRQRNWARATGIVLACLGSALALFGFFNVFFYGWFGLVVGLGIVAFVTVNVIWIVAALRTRWS